MVGNYQPELRLYTGDIIVFDSTPYKIVGRESVDSFILKDIVSGKEIERHIDWFPEKHRKSESVYIKRGPGNRV